jgi:hypothetical protein
MKSRSESIIPTGFRLKAQGCEAQATLGRMQQNETTPTGLLYLVRADRNPVGVEFSSFEIPRVASQPRALLRNPFGIGIQAIKNFGKSK